MQFLPAKWSIFNNKSYNQNTRHPIIWRGESVKFSFFSILRAMKSVITWEIERNIQFTHLQHKRYDTSCLFGAALLFSLRSIPTVCSSSIEQTTKWLCAFNIVPCIVSPFCHWLPNNAEQEKHQFQFSTLKLLVCIQFVIRSVRNDVSCEWVWVCRTKSLYILYFVWANINIPCHMWNHVIQFSISPAAHDLNVMANSSATVRIQLPQKWKKLNKQIPFKKTTNTHTHFSVDAEQHTPVHSGCHDDSSTGKKKKTLNVQL